MSLPVAPLALSGEDRAELERLARSGDRRLEERAGIVLACAESADGNSGVAAELGLSVETVRKWRGRFVALDIDTERSYVADFPEDALAMARAAAPNGVFFLVRIGSPGAFKASRLANAGSRGL